MIQKSKFSVAVLFLVIGFISFGSITNAQTPSSTPPPTVTTGTAVVTSETAANLSGNVTNTGGAGITVSRRGIMYGPSGLMVNGEYIYNNIICSDGSFTAGNYTLGTGGTCGGSSSSILECGQSYQYRAFATNSFGPNYGARNTFSTQACSSATPSPVSQMPPTLFVPSSTVTSSSANLTGYVETSQGSDLINRGFDYGPVSPPGPLPVGTLYNVSVQDNAPISLGLYSKTINGLNCGTQYNYRSFATNASGRRDGSNKTFTTSACPTATPATVPAAPSISIPTASNVSATSVTLNSNITSIGTASVTSRGFNYGLTSAYGMTVSESAASYSTGAFSLNVTTGLGCENTYHYRSFATNSVAATTSIDRTFTTTACSVATPTPASVSMPSINVPTVSNITQTSVIVNSNVTDTGGENLSLRGFELGIPPSFGTPYISNSGPYGTGSFSRDIAGLTCGQNYQVRATGTNSGGTRITGSFAFSTLPCSSAEPTPTSAPNTPTLSNLPVTAITATTATLNASLDQTGGANVTLRGFQYGNQGAYFYSTTTVQSPGPYLPGNFSTNLTGLECGNKTYHYTAYGENSAGRTNTVDDTFVTLACPTPTPTPVVVPPVVADIPTASNITRKTVTMTGQIVSGNATERGFRYGWSSGNYGTTKKENAVSFDPGIFTLDISGLAPNKKHFIQAYAKNDGGTDYSNEIEFTTLPSPGSLTGWAWSSNIGWLNLDTISLNQANGNMEGYAWSPHIGWVQFNGLSDYPTNGAPGEPANVNFDTGEVKGWIRALAGIDAAAGGGGGGGNNGGGIAITGASCTWVTSDYLFSAEPEVYKLKSLLHCVSQPVVSLGGGPVCPDGDVFGYPTYHTCPGAYRPSTVGPPDTALGQQQMNTYATALCGAGNYTLPATAGWQEDQYHSISCTTPPVVGGNNGGNQVIGSTDDGWDGWIELAGANHPSVSPGIVVGNNVMTGLRMNLNTGVIGGMAWGSNVVGWLNFNAATSSNQTPFTATCSAVNLTNGKIRFTAQPSGGNASYTYKWNVVNAFGPSATYEYPIQQGAFTIPLEVKDTSQANSIKLDCTYTPNTGITIDPNGGTNGPCSVDPRTILVGDSATFQINGTVLPPSLYNYQWIDGVNNPTTAGKTANITYEAPISRVGANGTSVVVRDISNNASKGQANTFNCGDLTVSARELKLNIGTNATDIATRQGKSLLIKQGSNFRVEWKNTLTPFSAAAPDGYTCNKDVINKTETWTDAWINSQHFTTGQPNSKLSMDKIGSKVGTYVFKMGCTSEVLEPFNDEVTLKVISSTITEQ